MEIGNIAIEAIVKGIFDILKDKLVANVKQQPVEDITVSIQTHITEVIKWSERIQFYGMSSAQMTDQCTVPLGLFLEPRKFRGVTDKFTKKQSENSLLLDRENYVLLGDPGAGKTTTLKRLARKIILEPPISKRDIFQYPIVIRLRELQRRNLVIHKTIADIYGIKYYTVAEKIEDPEEEAEAKELGLGSTTENTYVSDTKMHLHQAIPDILNKTNAILLLDGLDEVSLQNKSAIEDEIKQLAFRLTNSKIILTTRTGDFTKHLDGFNIIELCPLGKYQIATIAKNWIDNPSKFLKSIEATPFYDLTDRPLILTQLLFFFKKRGYLPDQPLEIYRRIINLFLEEWDAQRKIIRKSKYGNFNSERKIDFLANLSYHLTYKTKTKVFKEADLINVYNDIHQTFNLPKKEAIDVAREIETHTGLIIETNDGIYEFSHLSFQEYLCAYYLVREPFAKYLGNYLNEYPAPLSIAVALSSNPSNWFAGLILNPSNFGALSTDSINSFLSRLFNEKPFFPPEISLGFAVLKLLFVCDDKQNDLLSSNLYRLLDIKGVKESIANSLSWYAVEPQKNRPDKYYLSPRVQNANYYSFETPSGGYLPKQILEDVAKSYDVELVQSIDGKGLCEKFNIN